MHYRQEKTARCRHENYSWRILFSRAAVADERRRIVAAADDISAARLASAIKPASGRLSLMPFYSQAILADFHRRPLSLFDMPRQDIEARPRLQRRLEMKKSSRAESVPLSRQSRHLISKAVLAHARCRSGRCAIHCRLSAYYFRHFIKRR